MNIQWNTCFIGRNEKKHVLAIDSKHVAKQKLHMFLLEIATTIIQQTGNINIYLVGFNSRMLNILIKLLFFRTYHTECVNCHMQSASVIVHYFLKFKLFFSNLSVQLSSTNRTFNFVLFFFLIFFRTSDKDIDR